MSKFIQTIFLAVGLMLIDQSPVSAQSESPWTVQTYTRTWDPAGGRPFTYQGVFAYTQPEGETGVMLSCSERTGLQATIFLKPTTLEDAFAVRRRWPTGRKVTMSVGEENERADGMMYDQPAKTLQTVKQWQAARVFNSVVKDIPIEMKIYKVGRRTLDTPPIDDTFRRFINNCSEIS